MIGAWFLSFVIIGAGSFRSGQGMPAPVRLIKTSALWTILAVISEGSAQVAAALSGGLLIALFLKELPAIQGQAGTAQQNAQAQTAAVSATSLSSNLGTIASGAALGAV